MKMKHIGWLRRNWNWKRVKRNLKFFLSQDFEDVLFRMKDETVEDTLIELDAGAPLPRLNVLGGPETLEVLKTAPKSFARFGDGEIDLMDGRSIAFQRADAGLAEELRRVVSGERGDLYVGINSAYWRSPLEYGARNHRFYRLNASRYRRYFYEVCNREATHLDAACFCSYLTRGDDFDFERHYRSVMSLFDGKKVVILAGEGVLEKLTYDVFALAKERVVIHGPSTDAFSERERLLEKVTGTVGPEWIICMVLGPTASVLAADFADRGYVAWDIGHLAKDYDAWMRHMPKTKENMDAFWAPD